MGDNAWEPLPPERLSRKMRLMPEALLRIRRKIPQSHFTKPGKGAQERNRSYVRWALNAEQRAIAADAGWIPRSWIK